MSDEGKVLFFTDNLNDTICGEIKARFVNLSTIALFPKIYEGFEP